MKLEELVAKYGTPDPALVSRLNKKFKDKNGNWQDLWLDYLGHAELTKILIAVDPLWNWRPLEIRDGAPAITVHNGIATMWIELTVLGKTIIGVGSCKADKDDVAKELIGDALRNASMRFGIAINLWSKASPTETATKPEPVRKPAPKQTVNGKVNKALAIVLEKSASKEGDPLEVISRIVGRPLEAITDLTTEEAKQALESLAKTTTEEEPF
jgi:hypothetical protein